MNNQPDWSLIAKYLSGECSDSEIASVNEWLEAYENNKKALESYKTIWTAKEVVPAASDVKAIWEKINERISEEKINDNRLGDIYRIEKKKLNRPLILNLVQYPVLRYAAVFLIIASVSVLYYLLTQQGAHYTNENWKIVNIKNGEQSSVTLSDGTKLKLDAGSRLQYPETFVGDFREIKLEGEVYLEVAPDKQKPFKVLTGNAIIEVLGTKFNVRSWKESEKVEVAVLEGRVSLENYKDSDKKIVLDKGFVGTISSEGKIDKEEISDIESYISWMQGELSFHDVSLSTILAQIERWYDVTFSLQDSTIIHDRLAVTIYKNNLDEVLEVLSTLTSSKYKINGKNITLISAKSSN